MSQPRTHAQRIAHAISYYDQGRSVRPGLVMVSAVGYTLLRDEIRGEGRLLNQGMEPNAATPIMLAGWPVFPDEELQPFDFRVVPV